MFKLEDAKRIKAIHEKAFFNSNGCVEIFRNCVGGSYPKVVINGKRIIISRYFLSLTYPEFNINDQIKQANHKCNNTHCIRVSHLYIGTQADNNKDTIKANNRPLSYKKATHCGKGHEFTPENTYIGGAKRTSSRECKECMNSRNRSSRIK